jgi:hypothetical protein
MQSIESLERRVAEVMAEQGISEAEARVVVANENGFPTWERLVEWNTPAPTPATMAEALARGATRGLSHVVAKARVLESAPPMSDAEVDAEVDRLVRRSAENRRGITALMDERHSLCFDPARRTRPGRF